MNNIIKFLILILILFLIIIIFFTYEIYLKNSNKENTEFVQTSKFIPCNKNICSINLQNGKKTCPEEDTFLYIDPQFEECKNKFNCKFGTLQYSVNLDGSTNLDGICEKDIPCSCSGSYQCPKYILSTFIKNPNNISENIYSQKSFSDILPIQINNQSYEICFINTQSIFYSVPGCSFLINNSNFEIEENISLDKIVSCMNSISSCNGEKLSSPCSKGVLSFITESSDQITKENYQSFYLGCTIGEECGCGEVSIFDKNLGNNFCKKIEF
jgi:hypothetical protein